MCYEFQAEWSVKGLMLAIPSLPILVCAIALEVSGKQLAHVRGMNLMLIVALPIFEGGSPVTPAPGQSGQGRMICVGGCWFG